MSSVDDLALYEKFVGARCEAIKLTDRFGRTKADDPERARLWESVVDQTETARRLLEQWLVGERRSGQPRSVITP